MLPGSLLWAKAASPSSFSMGLPTTAIGKGTSRVGLPGRAHIPAGAENLVGEERLPGGVLGVSVVGRIGMAVHGCDDRTTARSLRVCAGHADYRCCRRLRPLSSPSRLVLVLGRSVRGNRVLGLLLSSAADGVTALSPERTMTCAKPGWRTGRSRIQSHFGYRTATRILTSRLEGLRR